MLTKEDRSKLNEMLKTVSPHNPIDLILYVPPLSVRIPFLDVRKISYWHFASKTQH
ncbi:hypothetical protein HYW75_05205 [Candidatus Pacearchaeota archaeon]|nr:hypothetical protein [Candidatus Pacearchaeota archaeon]